MIRASFQRNPEVSTLLIECDKLPLSGWQKDFVASIKRCFKPLSEKQIATLRKIAAGPMPYEQIARAALFSLPQLLDRWLPGGTICGHEFTACNPKRTDRHPGSFCVNVRTGKWADFAADAGGGDAISLAAYLFDLSQSESATKLGLMLGFSTGGN